MVAAAAYLTLALTLTLTLTLALALARTLALALALALALTLALTLALALALTLTRYDGRRYFDDCFEYRFERDLASDAVLSLAGDLEPMVNNEQFRWRDVLGLTSRAP